MKVPGSLSFTPGTPNYKPLDNTSSDTTPILSPDLSPDIEICYENLRTGFDEEQRTNRVYENVNVSKNGSPTYENVLTTISITYRSPVKTRNNNNNGNDSIYEDVELNPEKAVVPTTVAELPNQEASQPTERPLLDLKISPTIDEDSNGFNKSLTYKSIGSLSSTPVSLRSPKSPENSKKSLISPTEVSVTVQSTSPQSSASLSPMSPHKVLRSKSTSPSSTSLSPLSPPKQSDVLRSKSTSSLSSGSPINFSSSPISPADAQTHNSSTSDIISPIQLNDSSRLSPTEAQTFTLTSNNDLMSPIQPRSFNLTSASISPTDAKTHDSSDVTSPIQTPVSPEPVVTTIGSTDDQSSPSFNNKLMSNNNDKRKSCDDEIFDQNEIYQQVKYFRRSIHEINSLLDLDNTEATNDDDIEEKSDERRSTNDFNQELMNDLEIGDGASKTDDTEENHMDSIENFDSLEAENIHIYENVETPKNHKDLDLSRSRMHESEPKKLEITPEVVQELPVCSKCLPAESNLNSVSITSKSTVKNLTNKFEQAKDESERKTEEIKEKKSKNYDKDGLPPCLRAKNAKNSVKTKSLDENAFVTEFGRNPTQLTRRKSLDDRTSSYINSKLLIEPQTPSKSNLDVSTIENKPEQTEQKLNRERIEKYKEERRNFLREKYRSESFREDKDKVLSRLMKQKSFRKSDEDKKETETTIEYKEQRAESTDKLNEKSNHKKLPAEAISKFEGAKPPPPFKKHHSPLSERRSRPSLKELSDKLLDESDDVKVSKEDEFIRHRRGDSESEKKRHTYDLLREREFDSETHRRVSLDSKNPR